MTTDLVSQFPDISTGLTDAKDELFSIPSWTMDSMVKYVQTLCVLLQGHVADDKLALVKTMAADRLQKCTMWTMADIAFTLTGKE